MAPFYYNFRYNFRAPELPQLSPGRVGVAGKERRWAVENNGFKELNELLGSKDAYLKDRVAKQAAMLTGFLGMALLKAFEAYLETLPEWRRLTVRKTKRLLGWMMELGVYGYRAAGKFCPRPLSGKRLFTAGPGCRGPLCPTQRASG